jgi:CheY-like chemotaxis protein
MADPRRANAEPAVHTLDGGEQPLVLVVEDHEDTRFLLKTMLEMNGYRVAEAEDGEEGVRLARREHPRAVIMDATLPGLDGLAATRRIRSDSALQGVPVVFLSGNSQPDFRDAALEAGGTDVLLKPIALEVLTSILERHLRANAA